MVAFLFLYLILLTGRIASVSITIHNARFEEDTKANGNPIRDGVSKYCIPSQWTLYTKSQSANHYTEDHIGVYNPMNSPYFVHGTPDPTLEAFIWLHAGDDEAGIYQQLDDVVTPNTIYTLSALVGNTQIAEGYDDLAGFPGFRIDLLAGDAVLGAVDEPIPKEGQWANVTLIVNVSSASENIGERLLIRLVNTMNQNHDNSVHFDAIHLDAMVITTSPTATPSIPPTSVAPTDAPSFTPTTTTIESTATLTTAEAMATTSETTSATTIVPLTTSTVPMTSTSLLMTVFSTASSMENDGDVTGLYLGTTEENIVSTKHMGITIENSVNDEKLYSMRQIIILVALCFALVCVIAVICLLRRNTKALSVRKAEFNIDADHDIEPAMETETNTQIQCTSEGVMTAEHDACVIDDIRIVNDIGVTAGNVVQLEEGNSDHSSDDDILEVVNQTIGGARHAHSGSFVVESDNEYAEGGGVTAGGGMYNE
eukprot:132389_1